MVSTRSATKQTQLDDFSTDNKTASNKRRQASDKTESSADRSSTSESKSSVAAGMSKAGSNRKSSKTSANSTRQPDNGVDDGDKDNKEQKGDTHLTKQSTPKKFARKRVDPPQTAGNGPPVSKRAKTTATENDDKDDEGKTQAKITNHGSVQKSSPSRKDEGDQDERASEDDSIKINRAPVLHLWSACVTRFTHPNLSWSTCLSVGSAISTLCAISKGRSIGTVPEADPSKAEEKKKAKRDAQADAEEVEVMQFHLHLKDGKALISGKPSSDHEETLRRKFGDKYDDVKRVFEESLKSWEGDEDGLDGQAFGMYEDFRPSVPKGQKGWGRAALLNLGTVRSAVTKGS